MLLEGRYFVGSTSVSSTSMEIERMIRSTDTTKRSFPFLRSKIPCRPSNGPVLMRTANLPSGRDEGALAGPWS